MGKQQGEIFSQEIKSIVQIMKQAYVKAIGGEKTAELMDEVIYKNE